jgi:hypothetical protein
MPRRWKFLAVVFVVSIAGFWWLWPSPRMRIEAGDIKFTYEPGPGGNLRQVARIYGSFVIRDLRLFPDPCKLAPYVPWLGSCVSTIESQGTGGACLVANLNEVNAKRGKPPIGSCTQRVECVSGIIDGEFAYCDGRPGTPGQCWVKPPDTQGQICNRSVDYPSDTLRIWSPDRAYDTYIDGQGPYSVPSEYRGVHWRVAACLNELDPKTGKDYVRLTGKSCGEGGGMNVYGTAAFVP